jgi:hypothetical protein
MRVGRPCQPEDWGLGNLRNKPQPLPIAVAWLFIDVFHLRGVGSEPCSSESG